ncbi:N-acetyl-gamma-glutamyl-phosphate reductase [Paramaledivibacter caminithermalis]|uniref:N-acetyl-gamma-glutamyl-phosphate reductase n=1 Tax=Paramaledivibacter caminithermalis (strain DSM 15212 / CIP 107654 / DViRD3) TaxID=1121301 RepID=A0A1M6SN30_PARC5|nr:N-acetyl-gamma-glutamyl-phosphate reductase [Paramaledivibacter caminithermalis]SHK46105.1 N-acetyl-gamma-glutamyl-phosphate reductase [Paramaledivibacter caminithermalis DSM 15212]
MKVGVIGSTGYAGQQLVWFLNNHKKIEISFLASHTFSNNKYSYVYNNYRNYIHDTCINIQEMYDYLPSTDIVFIALPHGKSMDIAKDLISKGIKVIDLGADFRLKNHKVYEEWYGLKHISNELLKEAVYGLPEMNRELIKHAKLIANPGCYPTASILATAPLIKNNLLQANSIIIDAKSGVSGAGRSLNNNTLFCECNESVKAYKIGKHRHTPEIEQELFNLNEENTNILFTPHLIPMNRGILATCYGKLSKDVSLGDLQEIYKEFYSEDYFIRITEDIPETKWVKGSNFCDIGLSFDKRTNNVIVVSAIDNLIKGAAGQAIQNMNIMFGFDEWEGLDFPSMIP